MGPDTPHRGACPGFFTSSARGLLAGGGRDCVVTKKAAALCRAYLLLAAGLMITAFGIGFSIQGGLGTSPISSLPYVVSLITPLTVGTATICLHVVLILLQILILRRNYQPIQLMQLPVALVFGYLTDFGVWAIQGLHAATYAGQWGLCLVGILLVGIGVACEVVAGVVTLAGEGFVLAVCQVTGLPFGNLKVTFDVTLVATASLLSLLVLHQLEGVREGTVAAAILVGMIAKRVQPVLQRRLGRWISPQKEAKEGDPSASILQKREKRT